MKYFLSVIVFYCYTISASSQSVTLRIETVDAVDINTILDTKTSFSNKAGCIDYVQQIPLRLKAKGFITASIDSISEQERNVLVKLFVGKQYVWKNLVIPDDIKSNVHFDSRDLTKLPQEVLNYCQNTGYPFAQVSFDSIIFSQNNEISGHLHVDKGIEYRMDSIRIYGNANISNNFLQHYLKQPNGVLFSNEKLEKIDNRIAQLPYISSYKKADILMLGTSYLVNLYLQPKRVNKFDAIIGFLPNNNQNDGKLLLTVDAKLNLLNAFAKGEQISLNWQQIQPQSPRIDIGFAMPYIFNTNAGFSFNFNLYKRDSAFLNLTTDIGLDYELSDKSRFKIFLSNFSTRIIQVDTASIIINKKLPAILDANITNLGVEYIMDKATGTKYNKRSGYELKITGSFGTKKIKQNAGITSIKTGGIDYSGLYDSIETNSYQVKTKIYAGKYIALGKQTVLKLAANYGLLYTKSYLQNELYQVGGFKLLRGFDEENIFTNQYVVGTAEYRFLLNANSYFYGFTDIGFTKNIITNKDYKYVGAGLGLALDTKQGLLNVSLAAGKRNDLPFNLRETKIHVGIVSNF